MCIFENISIFSGKETYRARFNKQQISSRSQKSHITVVMIVDNNM